MKTILPNQNIIPYSQVVAAKLIKEGDILLFRGLGWFSFLIRQSAQGAHSHAAMASWHNDILECVEFREFKGGRTVNLKTQVEARPEKIDVFRPKKYFPVMGAGKYENIPYVGQRATDMMRKMTGLPYGWKRIWKLAQYQIPIVRWKTKPVFNDKATNGDVYPVCSTAVATSVRMGGYSGKVDLMPLRPDPQMTPPDVASSPVLDYMFTLGKD